MGHRDRRYARLTGTHLPDSVHAPMKMIGDCTIPVMLLSLGCACWTSSARTFQFAARRCRVPAHRPVDGGIIVQYLPMNKEQIGLVYLFGALPPAVLNFLAADYCKQEPRKSPASCSSATLRALCSFRWGCCLRCVSNLEPQMPVNYLSLETSRQYGIACASRFACSPTSLAQILGKSAIWDALWMLQDIFQTAVETSNKWSNWPSKWS